MKKLVIFMCVVTMCIAMVGCGNKKDGESTAPESVTETTDGANKEDTEASEETSTTTAATTTEAATTEDTTVDYITAGTSGSDVSDSGASGSNPSNSFQDEGEEDNTTWHQTENEIVPNNSTTEATAPEASTTEASNQPAATYDPYNVVSLAIGKCQAGGMITTEQNLNANLAAGKITKEEYDEYYPLDGLENSYYSVFVETDLNKASTMSGQRLTSEDAIATYIADMLLLESAPVFNIRYTGVYTTGGENFYEFRCYR